MRTRKELEAMKVADLRLICKEMEIPDKTRKRKKADNIVLILQKQEQTEPMPVIQQAEDRMHRLNQPQSDNLLPVNLDTVKRIGASGIKFVAVYLHALIAKHDRKREARKFRKLLRRAGYFAEAGVDLRKYHNDGQLKEAA